MFFNLSLKLIQREIKHVRHVLDGLSKHTFDLHLSLKRVLRIEFWINVEVGTAIKAERTYITATGLQNTKFDRLTRKQRPISAKKNNCIINLAGINLDKATTKLLEKDLNFAIAPRKIPFKDIICSVENSVKSLPVFKYAQMLAGSCMASTLQQFFWSFLVPRKP